MKKALAATGMMKPVSSTARLRTIWMSSLRAMESMAVPFLECSGGGGRIGVERTEDVIQPGRCGRQPEQLDRVSVGPVEQLLEVRLQIEGLDQVRLVGHPDGSHRRCRGVGGERELDGSWQGPGQL